MRKTLHITVYMMIVLSFAAFPCRDSHVHAASYYSLIDLGNIEPRAINNSSEIVGFMHTLTSLRAVIWSRDQGLIDLGTFGEENGIAIDINNNGVVLVEGFSLHGTEDVATRRLFKWTRSNGLQDIGILSNSTSYSGQAINDRGEIIGFYTNISICGTAFYWSSDDGLIDIPTLGGETASAAYDINSGGLVVGFSSTAGNDSHAFYWIKDGGITDMGTLDGTYTEATAVNDLNRVGGFGKMTGQGDDFQAFVWDSVDGMVLLQSSTIMDMNNHGHVVGQHGNYAYLSDGNRIYNLNDLLINNRNGVHLIIAYGINDEEQIICKGKLPDIVNQEGNIISQGELRSYLLTEDLNYSPGSNDSGGGGGGGGGCFIGLLREGSQWQWGKR